MSPATARRRAAPRAGQTLWRPQTAPATSAPAVAKRKLSYKEQREFDALPAQIQALEAEQAQIDAALADGQLFATDAARAAQLSARHAEIEGQWLQALERWEALGGN